MNLPALNIPKHKGECPPVTVRTGHISDQIYYFSREEIPLYEKHKNHKKYYMTREKAPKCSLTLTLTNPLN